VWEDAMNVDLFSIKMDRGNEPVLVPANIENDEATHVVCTGEMVSQFAEGVIVCLFDNTIPVL
jgi:hypothetical protein